MPQRLSDVDLGSLVPESLTWNNGCPIDPAVWIRATGRFDHLIAYAELLWPDFVEHDGCVLMADVEESKYEEWLQATGGDKRAVEAVINHVHTADLTGSYETPPTEDQARYLGRLLKEMWQAKLAWEFPNRRFIVTFEETEGDSILDFVVTFHQDWAGGAAPGTSEPAGQP